MKNFDIEFLGGQVMKHSYMVTTEVIHLNILDSYIFGNICMYSKYFSIVRHLIKDGLIRQRDGVRVRTPTFLGGLMGTLAFLGGLMSSCFGP